jgi:hypothetical protein
VNLNKVQTVPNANLQVQTKFKMEHVTET